MGELSLLISGDFLLPQIIGAYAIRQGKVVWLFLCPNGGNMVKKSRGPPASL